MAEGKEEDGVWEGREEEETKRDEGMEGENDGKRRTYITGKWKKGCSQHKENRTCKQKCKKHSL